MRTPVSYKKHLEEHEITSRMLAECVYSYDKRRNNYSRSELNYRQNGNRARMKEAMAKKRYCSYARQVLLRGIKPSYLCRVYVEDWAADGLVSSCTYSYMPKYYLYYIFDCYHFFVPLKEKAIELYKDLEIMDLEEVKTECVQEKELLSKQFCEKILKETFKVNHKYLE